MTKTQYYFVFVWGGVEPHMYGPYKTPEQRFNAVVKVAKEEGDEHGYFWLDNTNGKLEVGTYSSSDLELVS
jgi:hypothetical protein